MNNRFVQIFTELRYRLLTTEHQLNAHLLSFLQGRSFRKWPQGLLVNPRVAALLKHMQGNSAIIFVPDTLGLSMCVE